MDVTNLIRTERGWPGHFICSSRCHFRRNTLLHFGEIRIVVSTVGRMPDLQEKGWQEIGLNRHYETMAFHAELKHGRFWDADVSREISFESPWCIEDIDKEIEANDMHEAVVSEISGRLRNGDLFEKVG